MPSELDPAPGREARALVARLTPRRLEVLRMMCAGLGDEEISRRLFISQLTVRNHVQGVFRTLGCRSRAAAVAVGHRGGL